MPLRHVSAMPLLLLLPWRYAFITLRQRYGFRCRAVMMLRYACQYAMLLISLMSDDYEATPCRALTPPYAAAAAADTIAAAPCRRAPIITTPMLSYAATPPADAFATDAHAYVRLRHYALRR